MNERYALICYSINLPKETSLDELQRMNEYAESLEDVGFDRHATYGDGVHFGGTRKLMMPAKDDYRSLAEFYDILDYYKQREMEITICE